MNEEEKILAIKYLEEGRQRKFFKLFSNKDDAYCFCVEYFRGLGNNDIIDESKGVYSCSWNLKYYNKAAFVSDLIKLPLLLLGIVVSHHAEIDLHSTHILSKKEYFILKSNPSIGTLAEILSFTLIALSFYLFLCKDNALLISLGCALILFSIIIYHKKDRVGYTREMKMISKMNFKYKKIRQIG